MTQPLSELARQNARYKAAKARMYAAAAEHEKRKARRLAAIENRRNAQVEKAEATFAAHVEAISFAIVNPSAAFTHRANMPAEAKYSREQILQATCKVFCLTRVQMLSPSRNRRIAGARQCCAAVMARYTLHSYVGIGNFLGKDRTSIMYAVNKVEANPERYAKAIAAIEAELARGG